MKDEITGILNDFCMECFLVNSSSDINFKAWTDKITAVKNNVTPDYEVGGAPSVKDIILSVCKVTRVSPKQLSSNSRRRKFIDARGFYSYLGRKFGFTTVYLGRRINRNHATIIYHDKKFGGYLDEEKPWFRPELKDVENRIKIDLIRRLNKCK